MDKQYDLLVAGEINPDLILTGQVEPEFGQVEKLMDSSRLTIGSSSAIFACGAARLGLKTAFIGVCGLDVFGGFMLDEMRQRGVDVDPVLVRPQGTTGVSVILSRGVDRAILTYPGLIAALKAEEISDDLLRRARHLHIASYFLQTALQPGLPGLFDRAHGLGLSTSLDPNWDPGGRWDSVRLLLPQVDVFLPNAAEACAIAGLEDTHKAAVWLAGKAGQVAVKLGPDGALGVKGSELIEAPSLKVEVVDTVGAGDSFDAGILYGFLNGWDLERSLRLGVACGSLSTRAAGGTEAQPTLEEALRHAEPPG